MIGRPVHIALLICLLALTAGAGEFSVSLEPPVTAYHRPSELHVRYTGDAGAVLNLKNLDSALKALEQVEVRRRDLPAQAHEDSRVTQEAVFVLDAIAPGAHVIPSLLIEAGSDALKLPPLVWHARELNVPELDAVGSFADIILPPERTLAQDRRVWWAAALCAVAAVVLAGLWWWMRKPAEVFVAPPKAWEVAFRRLKELDARKLPEQGKFERYYVDLSSILRYYIEDRFGVHAPEQTTPEFLEAASSELPGEFQSVLAEFLRHCDRVKFARYVPNMNEMRRSYEIVKGFVEHTVPRVTVEHGVEGGKEAAA